MLSQFGISCIEFGQKCTVVVLCVCNLWVCVYVGFCTVWKSGAFCNNEGVCLVGIVNCVGVLEMGNSIL